jgi:hypothetical protein
MEASKNPKTYKLRATGYIMKPLWLTLKDDGQDHSPGPPT